MDERCERCDHSWAGCTCERCGTIAEEKHEAIEGQCICRWCNNAVHTLQGIHCIRCGYELTYEETVNLLRVSISWVGHALSWVSLHRWLVEANKVMPLPEEMARKLWPSSELLNEVSEEKGKQELRYVWNILVDLEAKDKVSGATEEDILHRQLQLSLDVARDFHVSTRYHRHGEATEVAPKSNQPDDWDRTLVTETLAMLNDEDTDIEGSYERLLARMLPLSLQRLANEEGDEEEKR